MKIKRIKLLSNFRGLPDGYEIVFNTSKNEDKKIAPICFVGLNGSGKSNALQVIAEMFYFLENFNRFPNINTLNLNSSFGFELEYYLPKITLAGAGFNWDHLDGLTYNELDNCQLIQIIKKQGEGPLVKVFFNERENEFTDFNNYEIGKILPNYIVGYSSGFNELISNPFVKLSFDYFDELKIKTNKPVESRLEMNRFQYLDYEVSKLAIISSFIFDKDLSLNQRTKDLSILKKELKITKLNSFSIQFSLKKPKYFQNFLPDELEDAIIKFKAIDPLFEEETKATKRYDYLKLSFNFNLNDATIEGFRIKFIDAKVLFNILYLFQTLNFEKINRRVRVTVKNSIADTREKLSDLIPVYEIDKKLFHLGNISFLKENISEPIFYKYLSDGEHQLLQILGSIILLDSNSTLFLFDEPETHFNPEWRSKFIWLINECLKTNESEDERTQELILTTHSPLLLSDSKQNNVVWFLSDKNDGPKEVTINTYGSSIIQLTNEFFDGKRQIADLSWNEMLLDSKSNDIIKLNDSLSKFGDSPEKSMILQKLNKLIIEEGME